MAEEIKKEELKEAELTEEDLEKVAGGGGAIYNFTPPDGGIGSGRTANGSGPEDHWFGTAGIANNAGIGD